MNISKEILNFYQKHPRLLVFTFFLSILGFFELLGNIIGFLFNVTFCPYPYSEGVTDIATEICRAVGRI